MNLENALKAIGYKITNGSEYGWNCWGNHARIIDSETVNGECSIVYDAKTLEVYEVNVCNPENEIAYRWLNPNYKNSYLTEAEERDVNPNEAWDETEWYDIEDENDILEKAQHILNGTEYDPRVSIVVDMDDELFLSISKLAHAKDVTFNEMVNEILKETIQ